MKIGNLEFSNSKGAIIVGQNMSGKSTILKRIYELTENKGSNKGKINIEGTYFELIYINAESVLSKTYEGKSSLINEYNDKISKSLEIENIQNKYTIFNENELSNFNNNINEKLSNMNINNILNTGISIKHTSSINRNRLVDFDINIEYKGRLFSINQLSGGAKIIVSILLNQLHTINSSKVILLDEIEAFLHPEWLEIIAKLINDLINNGNKIFIVTHNPILLSSLLRVNVDMLTTIEKGETEKDGVVKTINIENLIKNILNIFKDIDSLPSNTKEIDATTYTEKYIEKYIKYLLNQETCMMFFWENPIIVEGMSEKIYIEQKYNMNVITVGGFFQFVPLNELLLSVNMRGKFIMDNDEIMKPNKNIGQKNNFTYNRLLSSGADVFRWKKDFEYYINGKSIDKDKKITNAIAHVDLIPTDYENEKENFELFLNSKNTQKENND